MWREQSCWVRRTRDRDQDRVRAERPDREPWLHGGGRRGWTCLWYTLGGNDVRFDLRRLLVCLTQLVWSRFCSRDCGQ